MEETILKYQIALTKLKGIGPILAKNLLAYFGDVLPIFEENVRMLSSVQGVGSVLANEIVEQRVGDVNSQGCNNLIMYNKAALIQSSEDLERMMGWDVLEVKKEQQQAFVFEELNQNEQKVVAFLTKEREAHINIISNETGIAISTMASLLIEMEFKDIIKCLPGNNYRLR